MVAMLALRHPFGFLFFLESLHTCLHVYAWVCVSSILQSNGTMDTWSKPTFILLGHHLLFDNMLVCPFICLACFVCLCLALFVSMFFACSPYLLCVFLACLLSFVFCLCIYTHGVWTFEAKGWPLRRKQKGQGCNQEDASPQRENVQ